MALVAIAGPLTNFLLALIMFLIGHFTGVIHDPTHGMFFFMKECVLINLGFMIFNLIPIPPLDGSRVLSALAPDGVRKFMASMELYGVFIVYFLIMIFGNLFSGLMANGVNGILDFFYMLVGM